MRFDPLYYNIYEILQPRVISEVTVTVVHRRENRSGSRTDRPGCANPESEAGYAFEHVRIGSERRIGRSADGGVVATFIGDFAPAKAPAVLNDQYLLVPDIRSLPPELVADHPQLSNGGGTGDWMIIDKDAFELDGSVCNKIGVGYTAFRHQSGFCNQQAGSCLRRQPKDYWGRANQDRYKLEGGGRGWFSERRDSRSNRYISFVHATEPISLPRLPACVERGIKGSRSMPRFVCAGSQERGGVEREVGPQTSLADF